MYDVARPPGLSSWRIGRSGAMAVSAAAVGIIVIASASAAARPVVAPFVAIVMIAAVTIAHLYHRDGELPVFDVGALTLLITAVYSAVPLLGYWAGGLRWTEYSYLPLYLWDPGPGEVGAFAWRHVLYLYSLAGAYLLFRGRIPIGCGPTRELRTSAMIALVLTGVGLIAYFELLQLVFGVSYHPSYTDLDAAALFAGQLPHVVLQVSHNLYSILFLVKLAVLLWLMTRWSDWRWRAVLVAWLLFEGATTITRMGGRTWYVMLLMASGLLYHRLVRPLPAARAIALGGLLLGGALVYGMARDIGGGLRTVAEAGTSPWATMNEFQALFGMAYDLYARQAAGTLGPIPWQVYANDLVMLVPSQLLPFSKLDPCMGYAPVDGIGLGCVLGVISYAVIGLDWVELLLRGAGLGLLLAVMHRWYAQRQSGYWATLFYLCLCLWSYYTYRGSTLHIAYYVLYRFVPLLVMVRLVQIVVRNLHRVLLPARGDAG
jgi:hypothetical protein